MNSKLPGTNLTAPGIKQLQLRASPSSSLRLLKRKGCL